MIVLSAQPAPPENNTVWWIVVLGALLAVLVLALIVFWRRRTLLTTPGSFPAHLVGRNGSGQASVVVSYNETSVELLPVMSISPMPRYSFPRHRLELDRDAQQDASGVIVHLRDQSKDFSVALRMASENCSELRIWLESGPMVGIGHWREAPQRRQRRKYF